MSTGTTTPLARDLLEAIRSVSERHPVAHIQVFGSQARGTSGPDSDLDLLVEFIPGAAVGLFEMGALKEDLEQSLGRHVDLLSRRAVERSRNETRRRAILAHAVTVYAR